MAKIKKYRYTCDRCGGHDLIQDAGVNLNTGDLYFYDSIWCEGCDQEVGVTQDSTVQPVFTEAVQIS